MATSRSTKRQRELLNYVDNFIQGHGYGPSYREIMRALDYKSVSTVAIHIDGLILKGYLHKTDKSARSLEVITTHYDDNETQIRHQPTPAQEKWLVGAINQRFEQLADGKNEALDEIYVLVGSLKVLGLQDAYTAMKSRLTEYLKIHPKT
jgi:repressor LexA